ncbi:hypothetical protein [Streptomyces candidus]|uniref:Uncharacterized protein n=1 Tax=Streptomyces candidus TaxID=67283 RepID=A0A7X0HLU2_9ACTN|nr:hypothetical protein [Streptomyces candidus]MBB6439880.1 hypothetical protein [Streptomyces candidus]GHH55807.1 hypothetical protein GCM10018773_60730 [Streptomyces candidus]
MNTSDTPDTSASRPAPEAAPVRPGRKLGPIADTVGSPHRAWLEPTRTSYLTSGRTLSDLSAHVHLAKSKLSELLRGVGHYPRWEVIHRLSTELHLPTWPLYRLWKGAALDIGKSRDWVQSSTDGTTLATTHFGPPMEHGALRTLLLKDYCRYALAFLPDDACEAAVEDAFAILWLSFTEALTSPDIRRYAWNVLRATVMAKPPTATAAPNSKQPRSTPSSRYRPARVRTKNTPGCPCTPDCSSPSASCPTPTSTSRCCATFAASPPNGPPTSSGSLSPPSCPASATQSAPWKTPPSCRPQPEDQSCDYPRRPARHRPAGTQPPRAPRHRPPPRPRPRA